VNLLTEQADQIERLQDEYTELLRAIVVAERRLITSEPKAQAREIARAILCMLCGQAHWLVNQEEPRLLGTMLYAYARGIVQTTL
ncbi:hypothetical protein NL473_28750, partial [Klebsiella pneumoniae]|nr:hypothetical protein [Klebsiella pneumoniae]MCP6594615.1 hypothetical protein [Klebsiella pneumoniae]